MTDKDYGETWEVIDDGQFIERINKAVEAADEEDRFKAYDFYKTKDNFDPNKYHYVVRIYAGRNGCGEWVGYMESMKKIFEAFEKVSEFKSAWLIEWKNGCANDTSVLLVGLRDE